MHTSEKKVLGVIGGLGPIATAHFMELVIRMTDAQTDQQHLDMIIYNFPSIPDRTGYILDHSNPNPLPRMIAIGENLVAQGAQFIAIPCVTAHYFYKEIESAISVSVINGVRETAAHLKEHGIRTAGIMATDGTISARLFAQELENVGITPVIPSAKRQKDVMHLIYNNIKANRKADMERFHAVSRELHENGAQAIILGCTELSLIKRDYAIGAGFIDAMEVLAQRSVVLCGEELKEEYHCLISN
ncbi:MAG: amino acid racemase [Oscillospiraceae bacterium]|nr:amino acid racemase [Oscillospiraceae bacterium]